MAIRIRSYDETVFRDREDAGRLLAEELAQFRDKNAIVLGIPRGGLVTAKAVAGALNADLDIILARKIGAPGMPEFAIGAMAEDGTVFLNRTIIDEHNIPREYVEEEERRQEIELRRQADSFRRERPRAHLEARPVIVTDDGAATGATLKAALLSCRRAMPARLVCAFPAGSDEAVTLLAQSCDLLVALSVPPLFAAVSQSYASFPQVQDEEVSQILENEVKRTETERA